METIFTIKNEDLARLNPQEAVEFFRELLWAEARRLGVPISKVHVSSWTDVSDGGVDASVEDGNTLTHGDLVKTGLTSYQIKTGATFNPLQDSGVKEELFAKKNPSKDNLKSAIRHCLDKNGTYVLVCFKQDLPDPQRRRAVANFEKYFKQCGYLNPKVEVWSQNNIMGFLNIFPSLLLKANQRERTRFQTHHSWSQEAEMRMEFKAGQAQQSFISGIQNELRKSDAAVHIRVWGEPGIGKTRLVFEATRAEDLQPLVVYCDTARKFRDSDLMNELLRDDNRFTTVLVIDECDSDSRSYIWNKVKYLGQRIKLISIYNEFDETSGNISYLYAPALDHKKISDIIQLYGVPKDQADRWSEFCSGSPRELHMYLDRI